MTRALPPEGHWPVRVAGSDGAGREGRARAPSARRV